jgi:hypothetical protein
MKILPKEILIARYFYKSNNKVSSAHQSTSKDTREERSFWLDNHLNIGRHIGKVMYIRLESDTHIGLKFYVVLHNDLEKLTKMELSFNSLKKTKGEEYTNVVIGQIYVVEFDGFHRGRVLDKNNSKKEIKIELIDYGEIKWCPPNWLRVILRKIFSAIFIDCLKNSFILRNTMVKREASLMRVMQGLALTSVYVI